MCLVTPSTIVSRHQGAYSFSLQVRQTISKLCVAKDLSVCLTGQYYYDEACQPEQLLACEDAVALETSCKHGSNQICNKGKSFYNGVCGGVAPEVPGDGGGEGEAGGLSSG